VSRRELLGLVVLVAACMTVAALGGVVTASSVKTWYPTLVKPSWNPPSWVFGPVWTALYLMMATAAWLVWRTGNATRPMAVFALQLAINLSWSGVFFGLRRPDLALIDIAFLWVAIAATVFVFRRRSRLAAALLVPYLLWVSFATALNAAITHLNGY
jgi:benzodiazapine receptor